MRIQSVTVKNFKSLVDFNLDLSKFNCLIGLNGSGKSTVLQFFDFLSQLVSGNYSIWLREPGWKTADLKSQLSPRRNNIEFCVNLLADDDLTSARWEGQFNPTLARCVYERIDIGSNVLLVFEGKLTISAETPLFPEMMRKQEEIAFEYEGSVLSAIKTKVLPNGIRRVRSFLGSIASLDSLSPDHLRRRTRSTVFRTGRLGGLGHGGKKLAAFLQELPEKSQRTLIESLRQAYPKLADLRTQTLKSGWKHLFVTEHFENDVLSTEARHLNDGMLRLIAILAESLSDHGFVLFDEIENGINPELVEFLIGVLNSSDQQVLVTTHSPMILNYLSDEVAKEGVVYLYKTPQGHTKSIPFFSIPSLAEKLKVMGPGEAFVDTNLTALADEIESVTGENS